MEIHLATEHRRERMREYNRLYCLRHPEKRKESQQKYNRSDKAKVSRIKWSTNNVDLDTQSKRTYYKQNKEKIDSRAREYAAKNPDWKAATCALRRARKLKATPSWLSEDDFWMMEEIYGLAQLRTKVTGIKYSVDHIVPLQGKNVRGLHVPWNLRVITASENSTKHNAY